ncbi:MAG: Pr6Pr family membrane protein [Chloroflexi bacterium]|nr:Pr6Pr family membrane protein [Chloroflexota bacterium]
MERRSALALARAVSAALVLIAILFQVKTNLDAGSFNPTRFFAFFTILSNAFGMILFFVLAARRADAHTRTLDVLRGANVVYLTVTFIVVILLLSGADLQVAVPWVDFVVHKLFPVIVLVDWLIDPPVGRFTVSDALLWLVYPLGWLGFTLIRGAADGFYPYPFLNPAHGGYGTVAAYVVAILVGFLVIAGIVLWLGNRLGGREKGRRPLTG